MRTNVDIDDDLMANAMEALGTTTKRETIERSLRDTVRARAQLKALDELRGIGWEGDLDQMRTDPPVREWG